MRETKLLTTFSGITATCAVIALSVWAFNSYSNEKSANASRLLATCKQNYAWSSMVSYTGGLICEAFVRKFLEGDISYDKADKILSDEEKYFEYIGRLPEVKEIGRQMDKIYKEAGIGTN